MKRKTQYGGSLRRAVVALLAVVMLFSVCFPALRASASDTTDDTESTETTVETTESTETTEVTEQTTAPTETTASTEVTNYSLTARVASTGEVAANEADGTNTVTFTVSLDGVEAGYIHYTGDDSNTGSYTITPISGSSVTISYDSSKTNYVVFFLKPSTGYLLTGLDSSGNGDRYSISASSYGKIENYPYIHKIAAYAATGEGGGYIALLGFTNWNNGVYRDQTVSATGVQPSLTVTAVCDETENIAVGTKLTFTVTITPSTHEGYTTGTPEGVTITINETEVETGTATANEDGSYTYTVTYTVQEGDEEGINLTASASVTYTSTVELSNGQEVTSETVLTVGDEVAVEVPIATATYKYTYASAEPTPSEDLLPAEPSESSYLVGATVTVDTTVTDGTVVFDSANGGTWTFDGWYLGEDKVTEATMVADGLAFTGTWTFEAYESQSATVNPLDEVDEPAITKYATQLDENDVTNVTLTVGADSTEENVAVLFVLDYSTSVYVRNAAEAMLEELASKENTNVMAAVVNYDAGVTSSDWVEITGATNILDKTNGSGTNYHAGLLAAKELLNSSEISGYTTYLITISDGITYLWDENGTTMSVYTEMGLNDGYVSYWNVADTHNTSYSNGHPIDEDRVNALVGASGTIDGKIVAAFKETQKDAVVYGTAFTEETGYVSIEEIENGTELMGGEAAIYKTAEAYRDLVNSVNYAFAFKLDEGHWETLPYGEYLMNYLIGISNDGSGEIKEDTADATFATIKDQILYVIENGTVTDVIGNDFDLEDLSSMTLSVGGTALSSTVDTDNNCVYFGTADDNGEYPYYVQYIPGAAGEERFVWYINVPVEKDAELALSYDLHLVNKETEAGTYGEYNGYGEGTTTNSNILTNESATLEYTKTDGTEGEKEYPLPTVTYTVVEETDPTETEEEVTYFDLTVKKVWKDNNNSGSTRPSSVTVRIYCDGVKYEDVELSSDNSWKVTLDDLEEGHVWSYVELNVPSGYKASISLSGNTLTVTNTLKTTYTSSDTLLQTGQLNWPIPVLTVLGLALMGVGCAMIIVKKKGRYES